MYQDEDSLDMEFEGGTLSERHVGRPVVSGKRE